MKSGRHVLFPLSLFDQNATSAITAMRISQLLTWILLHATFHVQRYTISKGCSKFGPSKKDLVPMLKVAMVESYQLAQLGEKDIDGPKDSMDNSRTQLFPKAKERDVKTIKSTYATSNNTHAYQCLDNFSALHRSKAWEFREYQAGTQEVVIMCDSSDFDTNDGEVWKLKDTDAVVELGPFPRLRGEYTFCPVNDDGSIPDAITYHHYPYYDWSWIVLCTLLDVRGTRKEEPEDRGTLAQLHESGRLGEGSSLLHSRGDLDVVVSVTLLHEMFHAVLDTKSMTVPPGSIFVA
jgi:hypothetical protein